MSVDYALVLTYHPDYAGREFAVGDEYDTIRVLDNGPKPTQAELDAVWPAVRDARKWAAVRAERDRRLSECDWKQVADAPLTATEKQAWADYRQALRDVPQDFDSPDDVVWPETP